MVAFPIQNRLEIRRFDENKVEFLEGRFLDEKLPFHHKKKAEHSFELFLSIFLSFNGVFFSLECRTLVLKLLHGDCVAAIVLIMDICHRVSKYAKSGVFYAKIVQMTPPRLQR